MKKLLVAVLVITQGSFFCATPEQLVKRRPTVIGRAQPADTDSTLCLPTDFNASSILNSSRIRRLQGRSIRKVTLYYSVFRLSDQFDQPALNLKRYQALQSLLPGIFRNAVVQWSAVAQKEAADAEAAKSLFHGFVIEFVPEATLASSRAEITYLDHVSHNDSLGRDSICYVERFKVRCRTRYTGMYLPRSHRKRLAGTLYRSKGIWNRKKQKIEACDSIKSRIAVKKFIPSPYAHRYVQRRMTDTTVLAVFNRYRQWDSMSLVVDITGSMSPYVSQLMLWFKLNGEKRAVKSFVLFNDGNQKPDNQKRIGKTGGLFTITHTHPDVVIGETLKAMAKGSGGDSPENNCEALLWAQEQDPAIKEIFMIADNFAGVRDLELVSRITKPVHVIVCGVYDDRFHTDYLNIARITGGTVHSLTRDIEYLTSISEGSLLQLGDMTYMVRQGKIQLAE